MLSATFELFENICSELTSRDSFVLTEHTVTKDILEALKKDYGQTIAERALNDAVEGIGKHFKKRAAALPYFYEERTRMITASDPEYLKYVRDANSIRGNGTKAREFEVEACKRISKRLGRGAFHHTGWPRERKRSRAEYRQYLETIGFSKAAVGKDDMDSGFDILWLPPLGSVPASPVISIQCKNSVIDWEDAAKSVGRALKAHHLHSTTHATGCFLLFVIFNDYIEESIFEKCSGYSFVPLGISDTAPLTDPKSTVSIL